MSALHLSASKVRGGRLVQGLAIGGGSVCSTALGQRMRGRGGVGSPNMPLSPDGGGVSVIRSFGNDSLVGIQVSLVVI